jgi:hypothetical protein
MKKRFVSDDFSKGYKERENIASQKPLFFGPAVSSKHEIFEVHFGATSAS